ncbi:MAG: class I SAM-dependent methyltransferase, partial [Myxococcota bacterium]|nr:class I SAM-dependent methyltransferase [Myxococcota bacterium]
MPEAPVPLESPPCPLCGGDAFDVVLRDVRDELTGRPGTFHVSRCQGCGFVMTRPRPTPEGLGFYYDGAYSSGGDEPGQIDMRGFYTSNAGTLLNKLRTATIEKVRMPGPDDRVLDVGCSQGFFLRAARTRWGASTTGIDLDEGSIAQAVDAEACTYRTGRLPDVDFGADRFSIVTFFECLEHESDPVGALRAAHRLLEPEGLCLVEVPNWRSPWRRLFGRYWMPLLMPQHLSHFDPKSLRTAMEKAGFEIVHWQGMVMPIAWTASLGVALYRLCGVPPG